jgi:hypothetical protein
MQQAASRSLWTAQCYIPEGRTLLFICYLCHATKGGRNAFHPVYLYALLMNNCWFIFKRADGKIANESNKNDDDDDDDDGHREKKTGVLVSNEAILYYIQCGNFLNHHIHKNSDSKHCDWVGRPPVLDLGAPEFKSHATLGVTRFFIIFLSHSR